MCLKFNQKNKGRGTRKRWVKKVSGLIKKASGKDPEALDKRIQLKNSLIA
jgi:hypothetical protein